MNFKKQEANNIGKGETNPFLHLAHLDGLRAVAALYVVIHHSIQQFNISEEPLVRIIFKPFMYGHYAVDLFIVLSGFCLMLPVIRNNGFLRGNTLKFYKGRAKRILPTYYFAMALSLILIYTLIGEETGTHWDWSIPVTKWDVVTHLLLIQDIFEDTAVKINHAFWSISVEWRIYFVFPLLVFLFRKLGAFNTTILTVASSMIGWILLSFTTLNLKDYGINPQYLGLFSLGMFSAYLSFSEEPKATALKGLITWKAIPIMILISVFLFMAGRYLKSEMIIENDFAIKDLVFGLLLFWLLASIVRGKFAIIKNVLAWKPLVFVGTFAYSIYLIHAPLIQVIWQYILQPLNLSVLPALLFMLVLGILLIIGISYAFFLLAERPFMNKKTYAPPPKDSQQMVLAVNVADVEAKN